MRAYILAAALAALATPALAETQLERMERVTEAFQTKVFTVMLAGTEFDIEGAVAWDDEMRRTAECVLDAYVAETSEDDMTAVLDEMETMLEQPMDDIESMERHMSDVASPVSQERAMEINQSCGMMALQMQRMQESGVMAAMMRAQMQ